MLLRSRHFPITRSHALGLALGVALSSVVACGDESATSNEPGAVDKAPLCAKLAAPPTDLSSLHGKRLRCVDFSGANLDGVDFGDSDLTGSEFQGASLKGTDFRGADVSGASMFATLDGTKTSGVRGCPTVLPLDSKCLPEGDGRYVLVGPGADLDGADLSQMDLSQVSLVAVRGVHVAACPSALPDGFNCLAESTGEHVLIGRGADLTGAHLDGVDLTGTPVWGLTGCPETLPSPSFQCTAGALLGPGANLAGASFSGVSFQGVDLTSADLTGTDIAAVSVTHSVAFDISGCPTTSVPPRETCFALGNGRYAMAGNGWELQNFDLHGVDLSGARLEAVDFSGSNLSNANLSGAYLGSSDLLAGAKLIGANLTGANLSSATVTGASAWDLDGCPATMPLSQEQPVGPYACVKEANGKYVLVGDRVRLDGADLTGADLLGASTANLVSCPAKLPSAAWRCVHTPNYDVYALIGPTGNLTGLDLTNVDIRGFDFTGIDLSGALLEGTRTADLAGCPTALPSGWKCVGGSGGRFALVGPNANVGGSDLAGADLSGMDLSHAILTNTSLANMNLSRANLTHADLTGAKIIDSDLTGANLSGATMTGVVWSNTTCPDGTNSDADAASCAGHL